MKGLLKEFKEFIDRGNVVDLAVAVLIAGAFGAVVTSFTDNIFSGILGAIGGEPSLGDLSFKLGEGTINYGAFLDSIISFLIIAVVIFLVVKLINKAQSIGKDETEEEDEETEADLLRKILEELQSGK